MNAADAFGVPGLTVGSALISCLVALFGSAGLLSVWVRGMPDRKRAETESDQAAREASAAQFERLEREIARLTGMVTAQAAKIAAQGERIDKLEHDLIECERQHAKATAEIMRLKDVQTVLGVGRQAEQIEQSAARTMRSRRSGASKGGE